MANIKFAEMDESSDRPNILDTLNNILLPDVNQGNALRNSGVTLADSMTSESESGFVVNTVVTNSAPTFPPPLPPQQPQNSQQPPQQPQNLQQARPQQVQNLSQVQQTRPVPQARPQQVQQARPAQQPQNPQQARPQQVQQARPAQQPQIPQQIKPALVQPVQKTVTFVEQPQVQEVNNNLSTNITNTTNKEELIAVQTKIEENKPELVENSVQSLPPHMLKIGKFKAPKQTALLFLVMLVVGGGLFYLTRDKPKKKNDEEDDDEKK